MKPSGARILCAAYAGLVSQGLGLAEASGIAAETVALTPRVPWRLLTPRLWPKPLSAVGLEPPFPPFAIAVGGVGAAVGAALKERGSRVVQVQHPRMRFDRFDLVLAARHDEISGPNVVVTRTALHRATPARLGAAAALWAPRFANLPRPLVGVLIGGTNGRFRLGSAVAARLGRSLAGMARADAVGVALTPSRRTDRAALAALRAALEPVGGYVWDGTGDNPYFGLLGLSDAIIVTVDSVSMISEAVATRVPVMLAPLPGRSRRNRLFVVDLEALGRVRMFAGRLESWPVAPLDDTALAAAEMCRRLGFD
ncbi:MAG: mitochondrial fission ELM1 family protein [Acetobacteraceae bacterium]